jgi:tetratricopeptide (TPR) repeat protein
VRTDAYYIDSRRLERFGWGWNRLVLPIDAVRAADALGLHGAVLNHLNFGGWLMWARPDPVFIDGRLEVVGERFYKDYLEILGDERARESAVARYDIRWMIFPYATNPRLLGAVSQDPRWRLAYADHLAAIFARADAGTPALAPDVSTPVPPAALPGLGGPARSPAIERWLAGLVRRRTFPTEDFNRGLFHLYRGELGAAEARFSRAVAASGGAWFETYNNLGAVLFRTGRLAEARRCYELVLEDDPGSSMARERLAEIARRSKGGTS